MTDSSNRYALFCSDVKSSRFSIQFPFVTELLTHALLIIILRKIFIGGLSYGTDDGN